MKADVQLTAAAGFADPRSYVAPDGREVLYGDDWKARIEELRLRSKGICEQMTIEDWSDGKPERCINDAQDPHHVIRRSVQRDDRLENLQALCRFHHDLLDERRVRWSRKP